MGIGRLAKPMPTERLRRFDPVTLRQLVDRGLNLKNLGKALQCHPSAVQPLLELHGIRRTWKCGPKRNRVQKACASCETTFEVKPCQAYQAFCSTKCHAQQRTRSTYQNWLKGLTPAIGPMLLRRLLIQRDGRRCSGCKRKNWMGKPIPLESDHKDGNSKNNLPDNVRLLCPNCHAQTDNYKIKNLGNGRTAIRRREAGVVKR